LNGPPGLDHRLRPSRGEPQGALVLMHGRGTDENDLFPLLDVFDPDRRLVGLSPRGPLSLPPGGRHWYAVERIGFPEPRSFMDTWATLTDWVDAIPQVLGVPLERTVLGGFSQGGVMAYALALACGRPEPAGVLALSTFIPTVDGVAVDLDSAAGLPVAIFHGARDGVIGVEWGRSARDALQAAGAAVTYRESPVTHTLDPRELPTYTDWLATVLPPA
jgi:phospholipase/carboxylesterase